MTERNFSPLKMFQRMAEEHAPKFAFSGKTAKDFAMWKKKALPAVLSTLGAWPRRVPLRPKLIVEWSHDGLRKQRWHLDVGPHASAVFQINCPDGLKPNEKRPAILCWHGHGNFGKEPVMGDDSTDELRKEITDANYNYGHAMAKLGFVTFAIDWLGKGDRDDSKKPHWQKQAGTRDWCNLYYLHATMFGMTSLSINLAHGKAAVDFACTLPHVDATKLGVMGLSGGGTMTLWSALTDARFKAAEIICYSDLWAAFGIRDINYCGMQVAPGLYQLVDLPDLQGLLAPKPLLIDIGVRDACFRVETALECFKKLKAIYQAAGASARLELDLHPGAHGWGANKSLRFFSEYLELPNR
jgi:dienelactone hydrolase